MNGGDEPSDKVIRRRLPQTFCFSLRDHDRATEFGDAERQGFPTNSIVCRVEPIGKAAMLLEAPKGNTITRVVTSIILLFFIVAASNDAE